MLIIKALEDPRMRDLTTRPLGPISFIFIQYAAKILSNNRFSAQTQGWSPPLENSGSATAKDTQMNSRSLDLFYFDRNAAFWLLCVSYGLTATFYSWGNVWNVNLSRLGLTEKESGWLGFYTTIAGAVACVVVSL